jgi:antitoxin component YwqK of YwqJK toxin-antitoxin module
MRYLFVFLLVGFVGCINSGDMFQKVSEINKQPKCIEIKGLQSRSAKHNINAVPNNYSGLVFDCIEGKVVWVYDYINGKPHGLKKEWHDNGQLKYEANYKYGKQDGFDRLWWANGQLKYEANFKDGKQTGLYKDWYENGQLRTEENYKDGKIDGLTRRWYEFGQLEYELKYKYGEVLSKKCFDKDGNLKECD